MVTAMLDDGARSAAASTRFGDVHWVAETGSTNTDLLAAARAGAPEGMVLVADHQRAGRGRLDRRWVAPPGSSLLTSILLRPALAARHLHLVVAAVALGAAEACRDVAGVAVALKWPNDLLVGDRKLAGVLAEVLFDADEVTAVVVGIGLNVNWPRDLPADLAGTATALNHEAGREVDRAAVLVRLLQRLDHWYATLLTGDAGRATVAAAYRQACATVGRDVTVERGNHALLRGRATDISDDGHLLVVDDDGTVHEIAVGDVTSFAAT
jgi:BirA family transcriptional regulator, biotin operon repressor / biotin---[acetyl-CoA-carboxylase] ligase